MLKFSTRIFMILYFTFSFVLTFYMQQRLQKAKEAQDSQNSSLTELSLSGGAADQAGPFSAPQAIKMSFLDQIKAKKPAASPLSFLDQIKARNQQQ
jgi:hypothetical protein